MHWEPAHSRAVEFDKLVRMVQRQQNVSEPIPPFFIRQLINLESALNTAMAKEKEAKKKMNAANARGLNGMRQKVKKVTKEYEAEVKRFQAVSSSPSHRVYPADNFIASTCVLCHRLHP